MKKKILLTAAMALIGLFTFSVTAEAQRRGGPNNHQHVYFERGNRVVVWHNNYNQCGNSWGFNNGFNNFGSQMCFHMRNIWRGGNCGTRAIVRCNHRGCGMFGNSFRNGRFYNNRGIVILPGNRGFGFNRNNRGNGFNRNNRGNTGRYNQGGQRGNNGRYNQGGNRGNRQGNGSGQNRGNRQGNGRGGR